MSGILPSGGGHATPREQQHLETAHDEICTALTILQSNVELVRIELRHDAALSTRSVVQHHLIELEAAVERLKLLAVRMRTWH